MARYYFNVRERSHLSLDDEGLDCSSKERAKSEAVQPLAEMAKDVINKYGGTSHSMSVEVHDDDGPVLRGRISF